MKLFLLAAFFAVALASESKICPCRQDGEGSREESTEQLGDHTPEDREVLSESEKISDQVYELVPFFKRLLRDHLSKHKIPVSDELRSELGDRESRPSKKLNKLITRRRCGKNHRGRIHRSEDEDETNVDSHLSGETKRGRKSHHEHHGEADKSGRGRRRRETKSSRRHHRGHGAREASIEGEREEVSWSTSYSGGKRAKGGDYERVTVYELIAIPVGVKLVKKNSTQSKNHSRQGTTSPLIGQRMGIRASNETTGNSSTTTTTSTLGKILAPLKDKAVAINTNATERAVQPTTDSTNEDNTTMEHSIGITGSPLN
ncbi:uncharacterized protein LOC106647557 isoform X2 [Copidosoma floridanum]|uniref:uncharacterized protein LOC106647557 isoform X2 n=1 Tax=Copidosoma floridanum TaxID=29053 RepID=UPI0006C9B974|nr:uncharacterized protein LOC106647557 isoform X2 [Copidosoma floridanum]